LNNPWRSLSLLIICLVSIVLFLILLERLRGRHDIEIVDSKTIPNDLINYVFPYVVSFMGLDLGNNGKFFGFLLFVFWMFLITYRSGQILMNPLLLVAGWQLYEVNAKIEQHTRSIRALSKNRIVRGDHLKSCVVQGLYVLSSEKDTKNDTTNRSSDI
jgi:hypothetical protein